MLSRWSVATAVFGGACNLLFVILTLYRMHPASTPGRRDLPLRIAQAATAALISRFAFQFQGSRSATLLAG
jgi:hypothetical protein